MKHECKTMKELLKDIKQFNDEVHYVNILKCLDARLCDAPEEENAEEWSMPTYHGSGGIIFSSLMYGMRKKSWLRKELVAHGFGMRWLYCPFCGRKL